MRRLLPLTLALGACSVPGDLPPEEGLGIGSGPDRALVPARSVVHARHGMVAASHPVAVEIGLQVLREGGSAVDAAIATNAALGVLEPHACGIGGDLFALVWDAEEGRLHGLNASGPAPAAASLDRIDRDEQGRIPQFGAHSWTVPGCVDGWSRLHQRFGRLAWSRLLEPSIRCAREGEPVPRIIADFWQVEGPRHRGKPGYDATYFPGGAAPREGELFANPALAETYRVLAEQGRDAFYEGPLARQIDAFSREYDGLLRLADLAGFESEWVTPISTTYRGVEVFELPPNSQGLAALQMLNLLEPYDLRSMGRDSVELWHRMIESKKLAYADRAAHYADPAFAAVSPDGLLEFLLDKERARARARTIDPLRAAQSVTAQPLPAELVGARPVAPSSSSSLADADAVLEPGDTTYLSVVDAEGNMVSLIQSVYWEFGSGYTVGGFALQNRGALFSLDPGHPNVLEPGKRPFHTIIPAFVRRDGEAWLSFGLMGGSMQPQGHVQVLVNLLDFGMDLQEAGDHPRFRHSGSSQPTGERMEDGGLVRLEATVPASLRAGLEALGHRTELRPGTQFGGYQAIARDPSTGVLSGATESRKDGLAAGY